jgi:hypothetical protein
VTVGRFVDAGGIDSRGKPIGDGDLVEMIQH